MSDNISYNEILFPIGEIVDYSVLDDNPCEVNDVACVFDFNAGY